MIRNFEEALELLKNDKSGKAFFSGSKSEELLSKAEEALSLKFSPMYRKFLSEFGAGSYGSVEFLDLIDEDFEDSCVPDEIWYTLNERQSSNLPNNLVVIYETGDGDLYCQDYNNIDATEPKIVAYSPGVSYPNQMYKVVAQSFGAFLTEKLNSVI
ncbi:SMI1/KNR4 family protein [Sedimentibacter saalensis]|uniref:SUKH superfamily protein n=1 Tax=Sedimentibacter saalensis TaxID=130788 RepID=A0A562IZA4_9FIRM|nr:SMI1/KNR4 family protein [Sedimentibacter saalensis]TWH76381.1 SUKH superfamily protein [Sedimentibacter saalensis]